MPDISVFCPVCGRSVDAPEILSPAGSRDALFAGLAYVTVILAVVFLIAPAFQSNRFLRFHSWQAVLFAASAAASGFVVKLLFTIFSLLPVIGFLLAWLSIGVVFIALAVIWVVLAVKAVQGQRYELPALGSIAAKLSD